MLDGELVGERSLSIATRVWLFVPQSRWFSIRGNLSIVCEKESFGRLVFVLVIVDSIVAGRGKFL